MCISWSSCRSHRCRYTWGHPTLQEPVKSNCQGGGHRKIAQVQATWRALTCLQCVCECASAGYIHGPSERAPSRSWTRFCRAASPPPTALPSTVIVLDERDSTDSDPVKDNFLGPVLMSLTSSPAPYQERYNIMRCWLHSRQRRMEWNRSIVGTTSLCIHSWQI